MVTVRAASKLTLSGGMGDPGAVVFGDGAHLTASCSGGQVTFKRIFPSTIDEFLPGQMYNVTVHLRGCPTSCANVPIDEPCADEPQFVEPLFFCNYEGSGGVAHVGPLAAEVQFSRRTGEPTGHVFVGCPLPEYAAAEQVMAVSPGGPQSAEPTMELQLSYLAPLGSAAAKLIAFEGLPQGNQISVKSLAPPPPPRPPPSPPCNDGQHEACPATSCKTIKTLKPSAADGVYWVKGGVNAQVSGFTSRQVYCDMTRRGGGWTLVRVDDATSKLSIRSVNAVGTIAVSDGMSNVADTCQGFNAKLSDADIRSLWTGELAYTTVVDRSGAMRFESTSDLNSGVCSSGWSDKCGDSQQCTRWHFVGGSDIPGGNHGSYCGWTVSPCRGVGICWYGPHDGYRNHLNGGYPSVSIPSEVSSAGSDQGCGMGWVR